MSFESRSGTRGARQPSAGVVLRFANRLMMRVARRGSGNLGQMNLLVLHTVGSKSGQPRSTPLAWFPGPDGTWLVVASAAGAAKNPAWYHNLAAHPDEVVIEVAGESIPVSAEQVHGEERRVAWESIVRASARFGEYAEKTDRELPVIRLRRRG